MIVRALSSLLFSIVVVAAVGSGCASHAVIPDDGRARIDAAHEGELLYVKQSLYGGRFYDDDRFRLLHARRFEELTYLQNAEGEAIPPPPADEIVPAGTRVRVERIEWPDGEAIFRRPLFTPRYTTWIYLRVARGKGDDATFERDGQHIMLLPGGISDEATFNEWFDSALTKTDPNPWLRSLPETQRVAIDRKFAEPGMDYEALTAALGFPDRIGRRVDDGHEVEVATYGKVDIVLKDGHVVSNKPALKVEEATPLSPPMTPVEPTTTEAVGPVEPMPTEPAVPLEPAPVEPAPVDAAPVEPAPVAPQEG
ncbi:MAG TPA: hypothetical protein VGF99_11635 [Myxococcota bacterium]